MHSTKSATTTPGNSRVLLTAFALGSGGPVAVGNPATVSFAHAVDGSAQIVRIGDVALDELAAQRAQLRCLARVAHEAAHRSILLAQGLHDVPADEAGPSRDEDHDAVSRSKFFQ